MDILALVFSVTAIVLSVWSIATTRQRKHSVEDIRAALLRSRGPVGLA